MFWQKSKFSLFFFLCTGFFCLESRPQRLYSGELNRTIKAAQGKEVQLFLISDASYYTSSLSDHEIDLLSIDICIRIMSQSELNSLFSFERGGNQSPISLVCLRLPTKDEEEMGFSSFRMTFIEEDALTELIKAEDSVFEAFRVLHLIRE